MWLKKSVCVNVNKEGKMIDMQTNNQDSGLEKSFTERRSKLNLRSNHCFADSHIFQCHLVLKCHLFFRILLRSALTRKVKHPFLRLLC